MPTNDWTLYTLYIPNFNGVAWTQPGGAGTPVLPQQITGSSALLSTKPFNERTGQFLGVCNHSFNSVTVFRSFNYVTGLSAALLCCPQCSCVQRTIEPYSAAVGPASMLFNGILYP